MNDMQQFVFPMHCPACLLYGHRESNGTMISGPSVRRSLGDMYEPNKISRQQKLIIHEQNLNLLLRAVEQGSVDGPKSKVGCKSDTQHIPR
jgi:hypothetical protein